MAASSPAADTTADGAARATPPPLPAASDVTVEPAVLIAEEPSSPPTSKATGARPARDGSRHNGPPKPRSQGPAQLHLTTMSSSPTTTSHLTASPTSISARPKPDRPTSIVPVFWQQSRHASRSSVASFASIGAGITLTDNTADPRNSTDSAGSLDSPPSGLQSPLWARQVDIDDYVKIEGDVPGVGGYIVWLVKVQTLDGGGSIVLRKRYKEFEALRAQLAATFPRAGEALPVLPPKSVFYKFRPSFLEKRRIGLAYFLNCILLNPEFSGSPAVREFIFATD